jgi:ribosome-binding factor A
MDSSRLEHALERQLQSLISTLSDPRIPLIVTVERVCLSADGKYAQVFTSTLAADDQEPMLEALNHASGFLQRELADQMNLRFIPKLRFLASAPGDPHG